MLVCISTVSFFPSASQLYFLLLTQPKNFNLAETHRRSHTSHPRLHPKELMTNMLKLTQVFLLHAKSICIYKVLLFAAAPVITQLPVLISTSSETLLHIMATAATQRPAGDCNNNSICYCRSKALLHTRLLMEPKNMNDLLWLPALLCKNLYKVHTGRRSVSYKYHFFQDAIRVQQWCRLNILIQMGS